MEFVFDVPNNAEIMEFVFDVLDNIVEKSWLPAFWFFFHAVSINDFSLGTPEVVIVQ